MRNFILLITTFILIQGCGKSNEAEQSGNLQKPKEIEHLNLIILSDLSNRINDDFYPRQLTDIQIIEAITEVFPDYLRVGGRLINQKDRLRLRLINKQEIPNFHDYEADLSVDLGLFQTQGERIDYLNNKAEKSITTDLNDFQNASAKIYNKAYQNTSGADIWTFFNQSFDDTYLQLTNPVENEYVQDKARTVIILLTDGYLETGNYDKDFCEGNSCYFLSPSRIKDFRSRLKKSAGLKVKDIIEQEGYGIKPVKNKSLKEVEVLTLEFYDRSKSASGAASVYPTDFQITKAMWKDWLKNSGVKHSEIYETRESIGDIKKIVRGFLFP